MTSKQSAQGTLRRHDSTLSVWNENVDEHIETVYQAVKRYLKRRGWPMVPDPATKERYPCLSKHHYYGRKGNLELKVSLSGRHLEVVCFQNVANVENRNGNYYDFDKMKRMPYLLRKQTEMTLGNLEQMLTDKFNYPAATHTFPFPGINGSTALEFVQNHIATSGHFKPALGRADWHGDYNRKSADGQLLEHGAPVYYLDRKGRWVFGTAYYNLNNMWWVVTGKYGWSNEGSHSLFVAKPEDLRTKSNSGVAFRRINALIAKAAADRDFMRAHVLQTVLEQRFPKEVNQAALKAA